MIFPEPSTQYPVYNLKQPKFSHSPSRELVLCATIYKIDNQQGPTV